MTIFFLKLKCKNTNVCDYYSFLCLNSKSKSVVAEFDVVHSCVSVAFCDFARVNWVACSVFLADLDFKFLVFFIFFKSGLLF